MNVPTSTRGTVLRAGAWTLFLISVSIAIGYTAWPSDAIAPAAAAPLTRTSAAANMAIGSASPGELRTTGRQIVTQATPEPALTFAQYVEQLVRIGTTTSRLLLSDDTEGADRSDAEARRVFAKMMERIPEAPSEALAALTDHTAPAANGEAPPADHLRRRIWNLALAAGLQVFHRQSLGGAERGPVEELVAASLVAMPASTDLANELCAHLADRPYLGAAHEDAVLELVAASGAGEFPVEVATTLLSTLWRNMQSTGQRTSEELTGLALLLLQDGNATERASAAQLLLVDPRYRLVLLEHLRSSGDRNLAREVAMVAARVLEPATALEMLTATASMTADFVAPYLTLGHRDPELLQRQYELQLANGTSPGLRGELVRGVGFTKDPRGLATAQLAFGSDPDPDVRLKALFVLTANAADALGEQSVSAALRDPAIRDNPSRLATVVLVLENLASAGLVNAVDRLGQQLLACGSLTDYSQRSLRELLARTLPHGGR